MNCGISDQQGEKITIQHFAGILAYQLIEMAKQLEGSGSSKFLPEVSHEVVTIQDSSSSFSSPTLTCLLAVTSGRHVIWTSPDASGLVHYLVKYEVTTDPSEQKRTKMSTEVKSSPQKKSPKSVWDQPSEVVKTELRFGLLVEYPESDDEDS